MPNIANTSVVVNFNQVEFKLGYSNNVTILQRII
jgi:hypothetical protein